MTEKNIVIINSKLTFSISINILYFVMAHSDRVKKYIFNMLDNTTCATNGDEFWFYDDNQWVIQYNINKFDHKSFIYNPFVVKNFSEMFSFDDQEISNLFMEWLKEKTKLKISIKKSAMKYSFATDFEDWDDVKNNCVELKTSEVFPTEIKSNQENEPILF